jgi:nitroimidazol reductase NimA-like FMN-containing flavoprotein (pyridoxamine 5'-phosphate oxidase superfamily)
MPRPLSQAEIDELLHGDHVARLATIDSAGYPHVTPLWFLWAQEALHLASDTGRPHLARIAANPRVGLVVDTEDPEREDGERPNRQIRVVGNAELLRDTDGAWTKRIWVKYRSGHPEPDALTQRLHGRNRTHILITPHQITAIASL